jgi:hypothetical protein
MVARMFVGRQVWGLPSLAKLVALPLKAGYDMDIH